MDILNFQDEVLVTGGTGMVGKALQKAMPYAHYIGSEYDLTRYERTVQLFEEKKPRYVIHLAAKVSGMLGNMNAIGEHYLDNVLMNTNVLEVARKFEVKKLMSILSTCVYPEFAALPLVEEDMHFGEPHSTNMGYGFSKRMVDIQSRTYRTQYGCNFVNIIPNNLFGQHDHFHLIKSHVIPSVIRKVYEAKRKQESIVLWGDGSPRREFTYSRDMADIIVFCFNNFEGEKPINVGNPGEYSIKELATVISDALGYDGQIKWDTSYSNGQSRKPSDNSKFIELGWKNENYTDFREAITMTCEWFLENYPNVRGVE